jgi:hypothetical protein
MKHSEQRQRRDIKIKRRERKKSEWERKIPEGHRRGWNECRWYFAKERAEKKWKLSIKFSCDIRKWYLFMNFPAWKRAVLRLPDYCTGITAREMRLIRQPNLEFLHHRRVLSFILACLFAAAAVWKINCKRLFYGKARWVSRKMQTSDTHTEKGMASDW